jgi:hypothetical protein
VGRAAKIEGLARQGDIEMSKTFVIQSLLGNYAINIGGAKPVVGEYLDVYPNKSAAENQVQRWTFVASSDHPNYFYIQNPPSGWVIDIARWQSGAVTPGTLLDAYTQKQPGYSSNQLWKAVPGPVPNYFFIQSLLNHLVIDVAEHGAGAAGVKPGANLNANDMKDVNASTTANQLWTVLSADGFNLVISAFPSESLQTVIIDCTGFFPACQLSGNWQYQYRNASYQTTSGSYIGNANLGGEYVLSLPIDLGISASQGYLTIDVQNNVTGVNTTLAWAWDGSSFAPVSPGSV